MKSSIRFIILLLALATVWMIRGQLLDSSHRRVDDRQWVRLVDEPPPPPPKPEPPPESPPEPETLEEATAEIPEGMIGEPQDSGEPLDDALGVEEEGAAGSDSFGLRAKKGGKDLLQLKEQQPRSKSSGKRGLLFLAYGNSISHELEAFLKADAALRGKAFVAVVSVWVSPSGKIERCEIEQSSGNRSTDDRLLQLISTFTGRLSAPPSGLPQPIKIRIRSKTESGLSALMLPARRPS